jgi:uncharacterized membrane protein YphA (DoxX/SURF4 family)
VLVLGLFLCQTISGGSRRRLIALLSLLATFVLLVGTFTRVASVGAFIVLVVNWYCQDTYLIASSPLGVPDRGKFNSGCERPAIGLVRGRWKSRWPRV